MEAKMDACDHQFEYYKSDSYKQEVGYRSLRCVSIDYFFCTNCLEQKEIKQDETFNQTERERLPDWAKVITKRVAPDQSTYGY